MIATGETRYHYLLLFTAWAQTWLLRECTYFRYIPPHMREDSGSGLSTQNGSLDRGPQHKHASRQGHTTQHSPGPQKAKADSPSLPPGMPSLARNSAVQSSSNTGLEPAHKQNSLDTAPYAAASDPSDSRQLVVTRSDVSLTMPDMASGSSADQDTDVTLRADSAAANEEGRRQRKFREGFGAYTAPPVLGKLQRASKPALVSLVSRPVTVCGVCAYPMTALQRLSLHITLSHISCCIPPCLDLSVSVNAVTVLSHQAFAHFLLHILYCMPLACKDLNLSVSVTAFGTCCIAKH